MSLVISLWPHLKREASKCMHQSESRFLHQIFEAWLRIQFLGQICVDGVFRFRWSSAFGPVNNTAVFVVNRVDVVTDTDWQRLTRVRLLDHGLPEKMPLNEKYVILAHKWESPVHPKLNWHNPLIVLFDYCVNRIRRKCTNFEIREICDSIMEEKSMRTRWLMDTAGAYYSYLWWNTTNKTI